MRGAPPLPARNATSPTVTPSTPPPPKARRVAPDIRALPRLARILEDGSAVMHHIASIEPETDADAPGRRRHVHPRGAGPAVAPDGGRPPHRGAEEGAAPLRRGGQQLAGMLDSRSLETADDTDRVSTHMSAVPSVLTPVDAGCRRRWTRCCKADVSGLPVVSGGFLIGLVTQNALLAGGSRGRGRRARRLGSDPENRASRGGAFSPNVVGPSPVNSTMPCADRPRRVLLVEDERDVRDALAEVLESGAATRCFAPRTARRRWAS